MPYMTGTGRLLLENWLHTLCQGQPTEMVRLYTRDAVLVPTLSSIRQGHPQILDYFNDFLSRDGLCGRVDTLIEQEAGHDLLISGLYTFAWRENGQVKTVQARYTMLFRPLMGYGWKVVNHHSSAVP